MTTEIFVDDRSHSETPAPNVEVLEPPLAATLMLALYNIARANFEFSRHPVKC